MDILIARPDKVLQTRKSLADIQRFYQILLEVCKELGLKHEIRSDQVKRIIPNKKGLSLCWHSTSPEIINGVYHLKKGYLNGYMYFDRMGYSGWSELAKNYTPPKYMSDRRKDFVDKVSSKLISKGTTKLRQSNRIVTERNYVVVLGQMPNDSVSKLAYIKTENLFKAVKTGLPEYKVLFKNHPNVKGASTIDGHIHDVIYHAKAVYTVNSGAGFEALLQNKRVFVAGDCDYKWVAQTVKTIQDIKDTAHLIEEPIDIEANYAFLYHCLSEYFLDTHSKEAIKSRLLKAIERYRKGQDAYREGAEEKDYD